MTGYAHTVLARDGREVTMEIKTVNHKILDVSLRMPRNCMFLEDSLKKTVAKHLKRGHVDVFMTYSNNRVDATLIEVNMPLLLQYKKAIETISSTLSCKEDATATFYASQSDVLVQTQQEEDKETLMALAIEAITKVLQDVAQMRNVEGEALQQDILSHLSILENITKDILHLAPQVPVQYREKLTARIAQAEVGQVDAARIAQEVAIWADKAAIDEELARLTSHFKQMHDIVAKDEPMGRKLDFLIQEMNREVNTIGSKAGNVDITNLVIMAKAELEKMREQVQNVE